MEMKTNEHIKKLRKEARITQEQMGSMLGMKRSTYAHTESYGKFKYEDLKIIALHFNRTVEELVEGDNIITRIAAENAKRPKEEIRLNQPSNTYITDDGINANLITANERQLIKFYREADSEDKILILNLAKKLGTK